MQPRNQSALLRLTLCISSLALSRIGLAQTTNFTATSGSWYDAANWSAGVPVAGTGTAVLDNGGTALVSDPTQAASTNLIITGTTTGAGGIINVSDGSISTSSDIRIGGTGAAGGSGVGTMIQSGGSVLVGGTGNLNLGFSATTAGVNNGVGTYVMSGGTLAINSSTTSIVGIAIGNGGAGYFLQPEGTSSAAV